MENVAYKNKYKIILETFITRLQNFNYSNGKYNLYIKTIIKKDYLLIFIKMPM